MIKSGRTFHCTHCERCVEKFDHHCTFVNNCLGYKNHKYFLCFIFFYFFYFLTSLVASFLSISAHSDYAYNDWITNKTTDIIFRVTYLLFQMTQFIPLSYQLKSQTQKLCKKTEKYKAIRRSGTFADNHGNMIAGRTSSGRSDNSGGSGGYNDDTRNILRSSHISSLKHSFTEIIETRAGFCYNLSQIFKYQRPSQEELRAFLFSESERFSTFHIKYQKKKANGLLPEDQYRPLLKEDNNSAYLQQELINNSMATNNLQKSSFGSN